MDKKVANNLIVGVIVAVGFIGLGERGMHVLGQFLAEPDVQIVAVCDVHAPSRERWASKLNAQAHADFREILDRKVHLFLHVKVKENWAEERGLFNDMGLDFDV